MQSVLFTNYLTMKHFHILALLSYSSGSLTLIDSICQFTLLVPSLHFNSPWIIPCHFSGCVNIWVLVSILSRGSSIIFTCISCEQNLFYEGAELIAMTQSPAHQQWSALSSQPWRWQSTSEVFRLSVHQIAQIYIIFLMLISNVSVSYVIY